MTVPRRRATSLREVLRQKGSGTDDLHSLGLILYEKVTTTMGAVPTQTVERFVCPAGTDEDGQDYIDVDVPGEVVNG